MAAMINSYWFTIVGVTVVMLIISVLAQLFLLAICDNYIFPPTKWTVKAFLLMLFILSVPSVCITWVLSQVFRQYHVEGEAEKSPECNVKKRKMKILVIDDYRFIAEGIRKYFPNDVVWHHYRIPTDLSELDRYDVLIVDNQGINNETFKSGRDFLKFYQPADPDQVVIYYSGLDAEGEFKEMLDNKGFFSFTKGNNPDKLVQLITENFKGVEK